MKTRSFHGFLKLDTQSLRKVRTGDRVPTNAPFATILQLAEREDLFLTDLLFVKDLRSQKSFFLRQVFHSLQLEDVLQVRQGFRLIQKDGA